MNKRTKAILLVALVLTIAALLFPPYYLVGIVGIDGVRTYPPKYLRHAFLFWPPALNRGIVEPGWGGVLVEVLVIALLAAGANVLLADKDKKNRTENKEG